MSYALPRVPDQCSARRPHQSLSATELCPVGFRQLDSSGLPLGCQAARLPGWCTLSACLGPRRGVWARGPWTWITWWPEMLPIGRNARPAHPTLILATRSSSSRLLHRRGAAGKVELCSRSADRRRHIWGTASSTGERPNPGIVLYRSVYNPQLRIRVCPAAEKRAPCD